MRNIMILALLGLLCTAGCGAKEVGTISGEDAAKPASPEAAEAKKEPVDRAKYERDRAQATKLLEEGHVLPPRVVEKLDVIRTNDKLSVEDGRRAFEFRKAAYKHCYRQALAYNLDLKGYVHMTVKYAGSGTSTVEQFETTLKADGIEDCYREAGAKWMLPEGAELEFKLDYSTEAAPTPDEIRKVMNDHEGIDHDHDHDHHGHGHEGVLPDAAIPPQGAEDAQN